MIGTLKKSSAGFSLIELAVAVVIIAILTAVAYPMYQNHVIRSRRADAKSALAQLAQLQEAYYVDHQSRYATAFTDPDLKGLNEFNEVTDNTLVSSEGYYQITLSGDSSAFTLTAAPFISNDPIKAKEMGRGQTDDKDCPQLTITSTGEKSPDECW